MNHPFKVVYDYLVLLNKKYPLLLLQWAEKNDIIIILLIQELSVLKTLYDKIFSIAFFKKFLEIPVIGKLLAYEMLSYLFFGVMTTVVNFIAFFISDKILGNSSIAEFSVFNHLFKVTFEDISTFIAWIVAVLFAYVTNKLWVFESKEKTPYVIVRELLAFFGARIISFVIFESIGFMIIRNVIINLSLFESENAPKWIAKIFISVAVVVFNYIMSKLVIFRKNKTEQESV